MYFYISRYDIEPDFFEKDYYGTMEEKMKLYRWRKNMDCPSSRIKIINNGSKIYYVDYINRIVSPDLVKDLPIMQEAV